MASPLSIDPNNGVRLQLASYFRIRTGHGGGDMWEHQHQVVLRQNLGDYLPKAIPEGRESVLFQQYHGGAEICSLSQAVTSGKPVPRTQLEGLQKAVNALKQKAADPHCDPNVRKVIESFRVPDPAKDPELYRIYGTGKNAKLIVLWGVEKDPDTAIAPEEAVHRIPSERGDAPSRSMLVPLSILGLIAVLAIGALMYMERTGKTSAASLGSPSGGSHEPLAGQNDSAGPENTNANAANFTGFTDAVTTGIKGSSASVSAEQNTPAETTKDESEPSGGTPSTGAIESNVNSSSNELVVGSPLTSQTAEAGAAKGSQPPFPSSQEKGESNLPNDQASSTSKGATSAGSKPSEVDRAKGSQSPLLASQEKGESKPPEALNSTNSAATSPAESKQAEPALDPNEPGTTGFLDPAKENAQKPTITKQSSNITGISPGTPAAGTPAVQAMPSGAPSQLTPFSAAVQPKLLGEVVQGKSPSPPVDGKVETVFSLHAKDEKGQVVSIGKVDSWRVDGKVQMDSSGKKDTSNSIRVLLAEGKHSVEVSGSSIDDRPVVAQATVDVGIEIRQESTIKVQQTPSTPSKGE